MPADLVIVANRLPVDRVSLADGSLDWRPSPGGLVTAIEPVMRANDGVWIGWPGGSETGLEPFDHDGMHLDPISLSAEEIEGFYEGFSNATLWPLYHDVVAKPEFHREWWDMYVAVNRRFAEHAADRAARDATALPPAEVSPAATSAATDSRVKLRTDFLIDWLRLSLDGQTYRPRPRFFLPSQKTERSGPHRNGGISRWEGTTFPDTFCSIPASPRKGEGPRGPRVKECLPTSSSSPTGCQSTA